MENDEKDKYRRYTRIAWVIYTLVTLVVIAVLVLFVASDNEERFFFAFMTAAAAYVFRPMDKPFSKLIYRFTGVSPPAEDQ